MTHDNVAPPGWSAGWFGAVLTVTDRFNGTVFTSAGPETYSATEEFCYTPGETYNISVSEMSGWVSQSQWIILWDFGELNQHEPSNLSPYP